MGQFFAPFFYKGGIMKKIISAISASAAAAVGTVGLKKLMDKKYFCPICEIKKACANFKFNDKHDKYNDNIISKPPMGWSSWNTFGRNINEKLFKETADAMVASGLLDCGYQYVNIDDCWHASYRSDEGKLVPDKEAFPSGMRELVKNINKLGLKAGIYSSNGVLTCQDLPGSLDFERIDAETIAEWGFEFFKYDYCHHRILTHKAPPIKKIIISGNKLRKNIVLFPEDAKLSGTAKIKKFGNETAITYLDSNLGMAIFENIEISETEVYTVSVIVKKEQDGDKYFELVVNGNEIFPFFAKKTSRWNKGEGRVQFEIKLDKGLNSLKINNPVFSRQEGAFRQYSLMGRELKRAVKKVAGENNTKEKPIVYSICEWGRNFPWHWGAAAGNMWRTTLDIIATWSSILSIYEQNVRLWKYAGKGAYNDPDMLEVGVGNLSYEENKSHFTLWCMMMAPLMIGCDLRKFIDKDNNPLKNDKILDILKNRDLIDIDQDALNMQCRRVKFGIIDILVKPLENGDTAVCFFNKSNSEKTASIDMELLSNLNYTKICKDKKYIAKNLWSKDTENICETLYAKMAPHGVCVYRISENTK